MRADRRYWRGGARRAASGSRPRVAATAVETLKKRADFLAVRGGKRVSTPAFLIEAQERAGNSTASTARFGFTVTKKLGNAVTRNRIRRRLKAAVAAAAPGKVVARFDYVIVARKAAEIRPFDQICAELERALRTILGSSTSEPAGSARKHEPSPAAGHKKKAT